ncbi:MAG: hypothetical protein JNN17_23235 [Verrucomicrobiaceae bacterium]|nr:hypothetical protein [Verrucomicrobiaceae bacterium]
MKRPFLEGKASQAFIWRCCLSMALVLSLTSSVVAAPPAWWASYGVLDASSEVDDFAVVNHGQLKTIVSKTAVYLDATLPGGAGAEIHTLLDTWNAAPGPGVARDDYAAVNAGQLKTVVNTIYSRLRAAGRNVPNPWTTSTADDDDYRLVNAGQVKTVFSFVVQDMDSDWDGYTDAIEIASGWDPLVNSGPVSQGGNGQASSPGSHQVYFPTPALEGESKEVSRWRHGYRGFQTRANRYLVRKWEWKLWSVAQNKYIEGSCTWEISKTTGSESSYQGDHPPDVTGWLIPYTPELWDVEGDTVRRGHNTNNPFIIGPPSEVIETISSSYTRSGMEAEANASIPPFTGGFAPTPWSIDLPARYLKNWIDDGSQSYLADFYGVRRCQYRWQVAAGDPRTVLWVERFVPQSGPVEHKVMSWTPAGATTSPVYTIDPRFDPRNGYYSIQHITPDLDAITIRGTTMGNQLDETREETIGAFLPLNDDDDDYDSANEADWKQAGSTARYPGSWSGGVWWGGTDTDLLPIILRGGGASMPPSSTYVLAIPAHVKVWANPDRTGLIGAGGSTAAVNVPSGGDTRLFVEGITQASDFLTLGLSYAGTTTPVDRIKITVFEWGGPLNVPGYSRHRYTAFGAPPGSKWIDPTGGRIMSRPTGDVNDVEILWDSGPVVGLCNYYINQDYMWSREVNVVEFKIDFAGASNQIVCRPLLTRQHPSSPNRIVSSLIPITPAAMEGKLVVSSVTGPDIAGQTRVADRFRCGWIQSGRFTQARATYSDGRIPDIIKVCSVQSGAWHVDVAGATAAQVSSPWYNQSNAGGLNSFSVIPRGGWSSSGATQFTTEDSPSGEVPSLIVDLTKYVVTNAWIYDFELDFAVQTSDAPYKYTVLARAQWRWDGSGRFNTAASWTPTGLGTTSRTQKFQPVVSGDQPKFTGWSPMNYLLSIKTWQ